MNKDVGSFRRVAIVGGGISGLTAAYTLAQARVRGVPVSEFLIEAENRLGGVVRTDHLEGFVLEGGPDSFISEKPEAAELCHELGLGDSLIGSNDDERQTYILHNGSLVPLPEGLMLLAPTQIKPFLKSPLLPLSSKVMIATEWFVTPTKPREFDESIATFVRRHFGKAMLENIVDPLLAGVYGGDARSLSVDSVIPRFREMENQYGSLIRGAMATTKRMKKGTRINGYGENSSNSLFVTLKNGLGDLTNALESRLDASRIHLGQRVVSVERIDRNWKSPYRIRCEGNQDYEADAVILALPVHVCATFFPTLPEEVAEAFRTIPYSSAMTVNLGFDEHVAAVLPPGFGFLVPAKESSRLLACTFVHRKFPYRAPRGKALLRCFFGGTRDPEVMNLSNNEVIPLVRQEIRNILGLEVAPLFSFISRWPSAMAQYTVGHEDHINRIASVLQKYPRLYLAGNAYSGIGISDCIRTGRAAAQQAIDM
ncbi:MAG: protoporphyrinogen oxidase [Acidobacteria bacterium]|nr:MAG: protoporphyrinogen oxidase [Acidobacteriota bacterium]